MPWTRMWTGKDMFCLVFYIALRGVPLPIICKRIWSKSGERSTFTPKIFKKYPILQKVFFVYPVFSI